MSACYLIAEAGSNHNGDLGRALELIDAAHEAGADAVKFQLFQAARLYPKRAGSSDYLGTERSIFEIIRENELPLSWLPILHERCVRRGIDFLASAFDESSVDALDPFVHAHKCASYEMTHHPLLAHLARKNKPLFVSTGTASLEEVARAVKVVEESGNRSMTLLQCTASYPTPLEQANVRAMVTLRETFGYPVGLSDHTREPGIAPAAAVALGASVVEKHFTLSNDLPGPDHKAALTPRDLKEMVAMVRATERCLGHGRKEPLPAEAELRSFARRSVFTTRDIAPGELLDESNIAVLRCGKLSPGLAPEEYPRLLGRRVCRALRAEVGVTHDDLAA
jgi:N-acetylneuraminate synthase